MMVKPQETNKVLDLLPACNRCHLLPQKGLKSRLRSYKNSPKMSPQFTTLEYSTKILMSIIWQLKASKYLFVIRLKPRVSTLEKSPPNAKNLEVRVRDSSLYRLCALNQGRSNRRMISRKCLRFRVRLSSRVRQLLTRAKTSLLR